MAELAADLKAGVVEGLLRQRAAELENEFLSRLQQLRNDFVKAREQLLFLEKGCDAAESAMKRAQDYSPVIGGEHACPNCYVRMNIPGTLHESSQTGRENTLICRRCGAGFPVPEVK